MNKKLVFLYSGQGSQFYQMGREIYENELHFKQELLKLDHILQEVKGYSVIEELYRNDRKRTDTFQELKYSHSAIYMTQIAVTKSILEHDIVPDYYMGSSLGEIVAMALATNNIEEIFLSVLSQYEAFLELPKGGMIAIFDDINKFYEVPELNEHCYVAAINYSMMYVVSGKLSELAYVEKYLTKNNVIFQRLPVEYAFHSKYIDSIKSSIFQQESMYLINEPQKPIISCCMEERFINQLEPGYTWNIIRRPIQFYRTLQDLIKSEQEYLFVDLSFTGTQANYIRRITQSKKISVYAPFSLMEKCNDINKVINTIKEKLYE